MMCTFHILVGAFFKIVYLFTVKKLLNENNITDNLSDIKLVFLGLIYQCRLAELWETIFSKIIDKEL